MLLIPSLLYPMSGLILYIYYRRVHHWREVFDTKINCCFFSETESTRPTPDRQSSDSGQHFFIAHTKTTHWSYPQGKGEQMAVSHLPQGKDEQIALSQLPKGKDEQIAVSHLPKGKDEDK